jgi:hypothetical protein
MVGQNKHTKVLKSGHFFFKYRPRTRYPGYPGIQVKPGQAHRVPRVTGVPGSGARCLKQKTWGPGAGSRFLPNTREPAPDLHPYFLVKLEIFTFSLEKGLLHNSCVTVVRASL